MSQRQLVRHPSHFVQPNFEHTQRMERQRHGRIMYGETWIIRVEIKLLSAPIRALSGVMWWLESARAKLITKLENNSVK